MDDITRSKIILVICLILMILICGWEAGAGLVLLWAIMLGFH